MTDLFLGIIAAAVVVMAAIQVTAAVAAAKAARRVSKLMDGLEHDVGPIVANLQTISADAARVTALATAQIDKADQLLNMLSKRIEETVTTFQEIVVQPARDGLAALQSLKAVVSAFRDPGSAQRKRPAGGDEEDLFIG